MKIKPTELVIMNMKTEEFWNNEIGWVEDLESADKYTEEETEVLNLPIDGAWIIIK